MPETVHVELMKKRCDWPTLEDLVPEPLFRFEFLRASWSQKLGGLLMPGFGWFLEPPSDRWNLGRLGPEKSRLRRAIATAAQDFRKTKSKKMAEPIG